MPEFLMQPDRLRFSTEISANDLMYGGNTDHYFGVGVSALRCIGPALLFAGIRSPARILDLPSGHGRVTRALRAAFPGAEITACDLDAEAVDYCARTFGVEKFVSDRDPSLVLLPERYDLIWCGSLLTHLDLPLWEGFLSLFENALAPGGVLLVTTHGRRTEGWLRRGRSNNGMTIEELYGLTSPLVAHILSQFDRQGFGYVDYANQTGYGISLSSLPFVVSLIQRSTSLRLLACLEHGWDEHQDVVAVRRDAQ